MEEPALKRSISLPLLVLYGLGVTIGAGIYVLLGATAGRAGVHAPAAFVLAAVAVLFSAISFSEMSRRLPVSAGEAAYVKAGFDSNILSVIVGLLVVSAGVVSSAAIAVGSIGYVREFLDVPADLLVIVIVLLLGGVAAWGITESILFAGLFTVIEASALLAVIVLGIWRDPGLILDLHQVIPPLDAPTAWAAVSAAALLAFFAFIGFEDIVNLAEEVKNPERNLPWAIFITLGLATLFYVFVSAVAVLSVPLDALAASEAPMSYVFGQISGVSPVVITLIAIVATLNGVIIQIVMASRVLYGLGRQGVLPNGFARVNPITRTPLVATGCVVAIILVLALAFPLEGLAEMTSRVVLTVFILVNAALLRILVREGDIRRCWAPVLGVITCAGLLVGDIW